MTERTPWYSADPIRDLKRAIPADQRDKPVTLTANELLTLMRAAQYAEQDRLNRSEARWWFWASVAFLAFHALLLVADPGWWRAAIAAVWVGLALFWAWVADWKVGRQA